ncbi:MAG TPA: SpoIIE family protein phosphatase [Edaphobacter sp.]|nr:SpoIIE family protein phosphatase [Edaphobacter sp.]
MQSSNSQVTPASSRALSGLRRKLPAGLSGVVFWLGVWFCALFAGRWVPGGFGTFLGILQIFVGIALVCVAIPLIARLVRKHMLWSLRNKLVLTYLLIGLAPVLLFVTLAGIFAYVAAGQFAIHLADTRILAELNQMGVENEHRADLISPQLERRMSGSGDARAEVIVPPAESASGDPARSVSNLDLPRLKLHRETKAFLNGAPVALDALSSNSTPSNSPSSNLKTRDKTPFSLPPWATELPSGRFSGMVLDGTDPYLVAIQQERWKDGRIFTLVTSLPVDSALLNMIADGLGYASLLPERFSRRTDDQKQSVSSAQSSSARSAPASKSAAARDARVSGSDVLTGKSSIVGGTETSPANIADLTVRFPSTEPVTDWATGQPDSVFFTVQSRPSRLYNQLFGASLSGVVTDLLRKSLVILSLVFGVIGIVAVSMALRLSRTITASVADLYRATQHIDSGDLNYRIGVANNDQLAELSRSFNAMAVSMQKLLQEQKEKERLQNEISIAQEVQANLFPLHARGIARLDLHGVCRPARSVSGDYYDFLVFHKEAHDGIAGRKETGVGIAIGDISGKGISAALLMATLHSAVRAYRFASEELVYSESTVAGLTASRDERGGDCDELFQSPGRILSLLNRHLYRSTQPEKYATLFLAHYDADSAKLTYSNAGQLPPLVLRPDGSIRRLDQGGTVVGLMDGMHYDEDSFHMQPGDILVAYSDGVTEPENDFGEFGEERMMEVVSRYRDQPLHVISTQVMLALDAWIGAEEQPDDITLVLARQT